MDNIVTAESNTIADRVQRVCRYCNHKWLGKPSSTICSNSKCRKYIGRIKKKELEETTAKEEIKMDNVQTPLPPLPDEQKKTEGDSKERISADIPADTYTNLVAFPFDLIAASTKKEYWKLTDTEKKSLAPLFKMVGDKWITKWFAEYPAEAALAIGFGTILAGKFALELTHRRAEKKKKPETYENYKKKYGIEPEAETKTEVVVSDGQQ